MAIPISLMRRLAWVRLKERTKRRLLNAIPGRVYYSVMKMRRREIVTLAAKLGLPKERLRQHFEQLREKLPANELGQRMVEDLQTTLELAEKTGLIGKNSSSQNRIRFKKNLANRPLSTVIQEMREYAEAMPEPAAKKAA